MYYVAYRATWNCFASSTQMSRNCIITNIQAWKQYIPHENVVKQALTHTCKLAKCILTHPYSNNAHKRLGPIYIYIVGLPTQFNQLNSRPPSMVVRSPT